MAISEIYGIYDEATEAYVQFVPCINQRLAEMTFKKLYSEKRLNVPMIYDYPETFRVYKLATFDDNLGTFENVHQPELLLDFGSLSSHNTTEGS